MSSRHPREDMEGFLDDDLRQVWALDRTTGTACFLPNGEALALRNVAKRDWRCPVPGCHVEITTVGGKRRHHFRHNEPAPHPSDGESEAHLAAKAMLTAWATHRLPSGASVREEETVKDPATALHRIADVMVTWSDQTKTAFEVEYKNYAPDGWRAKQADYDSRNIRTAWLLGHTRIKAAGPAQLQTGRWVTPVRIGVLAEALGTNGHHVLVINPVTQQVGTIARDPGFTDRPRYAYGTAWLAVHNIDECDLDPGRGIITPAMRHIDRAIVQREAAERLHREQDAARQAAEAKKHERWTQIAAANDANWDQSPVKQAILDRWGRIPLLIREAAPHTYGIHANPAHWHAILHETHLHNQPAGHDFTINDCWTTLANAGIDRSRDHKKAFRALAAYLDQLHRAGLITIHRTASRIQHLTTTGQSIPDHEQAQADRAKDRTSRPSRKAQARDSRAQAEQAWAHQQERLQDIDNIRTAHTQRWVASTLHQQVSDLHNGKIPAAITWTGGSFHHAIDAAPAHWHAHIYMAHIHRQRPGTHVDAHTARATLISNHIATPGQSVTVLVAIDDYLHNLLQRGYLTRPNGEDSGYVVTSLAGEPAQPSPMRQPEPEQPKHLGIW